MRPHRPRRTALFLLVGLLGLAAPLGAHGQATPGTSPVATTPAAGSSPAALFERLIRADKNTTAAISGGLKARRLFIDPLVTFTDITGDGRPDAIVTVDTGGAGGDIAIYVFSADGSANGALRAVYRSQSLYRATVRVQGRTLLVRTPDYRAGDQLYNPGRLVERTLTWSAAARRVVLRSTRRVDVPVQSVGTAPPA